MFAATTLYQLNQSQTELACRWALQPSSISYLCSDPPPPPFHPSYVRNAFPHFILHMFSNLFPSISLPWSAHSPPSLYLPAALLAQWQSHHTLSIRLVRPGSAASTLLVWAHQCQSVCHTLSVTLKRFRLPDIVSPPPPLRSGDGGMELQSRFSLALDFISLDISSVLCWHSIYQTKTKMDMWTHGQLEPLGLYICKTWRHTAWGRPFKFSISANGKWCKTEVRTFLSYAYQIFFQCLTCRRPHPVGDVSGKRTAGRRKIEKKRKGWIRPSIWKEYCTFITNSNNYLMEIKHQWSLLFSISPKPVQ